MTRGPRPTALELALTVGALAALGCGARGPAVHPITATTPATHGAHFPIDSGSHAGLDCGECHGAFDTFREFSCVDCHDHTQDVTDAQHATLAAYGYESRLCYGCHPQSEAAGLASADHSPYFPIAAGSLHGGMSCASCHLEPADRKVFTCLPCHPAIADGLHGEVGGYAYRSVDCLRCHADGQVDRVADHVPFTIQAGKHLRRRCVECHPRLRADKPYAADFARFDCTGCHHQREMDDHHAGRAGYVYDSVTCVSSPCHPDGRKP